MQTRIKNDLIYAMKNDQTVRKNVLRNLITEINNLTLKKNGNLSKPLTDGEVISLVRKQISLRKDTSVVYTNAGRPDLATKEILEAEYLGQYVPEELTEEQLNLKIDEVILQIPNVSKKEMGKIIKEVSTWSDGKADGKIISKLVSDRLNKLQ
jgi:hypothetical protein